jgi:hypothetical protein
MSISKKTMAFLAIISFILLQQIYYLYQSHKDWNKLEIKLALIDENIPYNPNNEKPEKYRYEYYLVIGNGDPDFIKKIIDEKIKSQKEIAINFFKNDPNLFSYSIYFAKERSFGSPLSSLNGKHIDEYLYIDEMIICKEVFTYENDFLKRMDRDFMCK